MDVAAGFGAQEHWAKIEVAATEEEREVQRSRLRSRHDLDAFVLARQAVDPKRILGNEAIDCLLSA